MGEYADAALEYFERRNTDYNAIPKNNCNRNQGLFTNDYPTAHRDYVQEAGKQKITWQTPKFVAGDIVKLKTGTAAIRVLNTTSTHLSGEYVKCKKQITSRRISDFEPYTETLNEEIMEKTKLYQVKGTDRYGTFEAKNRKGEMLLSMSDSNGYEAYSMDALEIVMPYTFDVTFSTSGSTYSYLGKEDALKVGDCLLTTDGSFAVVTAVDTKSERATKEFPGVKLVTEAI